MSLPPEMPELTPIESEPAAPDIAFKPRGWNLLHVLGAVAAFVIAWAAFGTLAMLAARLLPSRAHATVEQLSTDVFVMIPAEIAAYGVLLLVIFSLVREHTGEPVFQALQWRWPEMAAKYIGMGAVLALTVTIVSRFLPVPESLPIDKLFRTRAAAIVMAGFGITVAPLVEEIFFRGFFFPALRRATGEVTAIIVVSGAFALLHQAQLAAAWAPLLLLFGVGLVLTTVRARTGSLAASFLIHAGYNFTLFGMLFLATQGFTNLKAV